MSQSPKLLTAAEVAQRLSVDTDTVRRWVRDGSIVGYRLGAGTWRIDAASVEQFIERSRVRKGGFVSPLKEE